jgi:hypothetical protein
MINITGDSGCGALDRRRLQYQIGVRSRPLRQMNVRHLPTLDYPWSLCSLCIRLQPELKPPPSHLFLPSLYYFAVVISFLVLLLGTVRTVFFVFVPPCLPSAVAKSIRICHLVGQETSNVRFAPGVPPTSK